jgi:hypothetical protein
MQYLRERLVELPSLAGSMYYDVMNGRRLELEAINGAAVRIGRELGVPTPLNFAVYAGLLPYANGGGMTDRVRVLRAAQIALLGAVTDSLLAVSVDYVDGKLDIAFYLNGELTAEDRETFQIAGTEFYAYYGGDARDIEERFVENAHEARPELEGGAQWAFIRAGYRRDGYHPASDPN